MVWIAISNENADYDAVESKIMINLDLVQEFFINDDSEIVFCFEVKKETVESFSTREDAQRAYAKYSDMLIPKFPERDDNDLVTIGDLKRMQE